MGLSRAALPVDWQVQPIERVERVGWGRLQLQLGQQGEVVRGDVGVGAAGDVVVDEPLAVQWSHQAQDAHVGLGEEDVVDHALQTQRHHVLSILGLGVYLRDCTDLCTLNTKLQRLLA